MPRRSSGGAGRRSYSTGRPSFRSTPSLRKKSSPKPAQAKEEKAPPPKKVETNDHISSTFGQRFWSSVEDGFSFGAGNAMGHRFVEAIFGPRTIRRETVLPATVKEVATVSANDDNQKLKDHSETCSISFDAFQDCLNVEGNNLRNCQFFMNSLFECKRNSNSNSFNF